MGTSLSGLTPATTFDGLLKTSDNDAIGTGLKTIGTGDGTDSVLQLSDSELNVAGQFNVDTGNALNTINLRGDSLVINQIYQANEVTYNSIAMVNSSGIRLNNGSSTTLVARSGNVGIGGITNVPTARLQVKGSGATSATTSLLVQNSAGTDIFKIVDDNTMLYHTHKFRSAGGYLYIDGEGNPDRSLKIGQSFTASSYGGHIFKTYDGTAYSEAMRITGANDQLVGIGETTPTARLHVKGSGNDNTTTSLLVQNSDGDDVLKVGDDGGTTIKSFGASNTLVVDSSSGTSSLEMQAIGAQKFRIQASSTTSRFSVNNTNGFNFLGNAIFTSGAFDTADARLHVKGSGATSATTALLVQNSAGAEHLKVTDDGIVNVRQNLIVNHPSVSSRFISLSWGAIGANSTNDELSLYGGGSTLGSIMYLNGSAKSSAPQAIGMKTSGVLIAPSMVQSSFAPSAQLQVKGSGNDATTTALLVQNSDGDDMLKVGDDGRVLVDEYIYPADGTTNSRFRVSNSGGTYMYYSTGNLKLNPNLVYTSTTYGTVFTVGASTGDFNINGATGAKMAIKGNGATSATTALLVQNSAGTDIFKVNDAGQAVASGSMTAAFFAAGTSILGSAYARIRNTKIYPSQSGTGVNIQANATNNQPDTSAVLQADSTTQGFLPPRMTETERDAISSPAAGLMVYNTTTNTAECWNGSAWMPMF